ncbi:MAG: flagellar basal body protein [Paracoccaceae bacterium]
MFEKLEITRMAQALSAHAGARLGLIAQNVANADTPGYKAKDLPDFASVWRDGGNDQAVTRNAPGDASPDGNTVSLEHEMLAAADVRQSNEMALAIYRSTSDILRASLGRSR